MEPHRVNAPDVDKLRALLDGRHASVRDCARREVERQARALDDCAAGPLNDYRDEVLATVREMTGTGLTSVGLPLAYGGRGDLAGSVVVFETLAFGDLSVLIKMGVQFGLFGGAVLQLGTHPHHETYLPDIIAGRLLGCFAMTEIGHGSDVQSLATSATFLPESEEFEIHTPNRLARKNYIGNAARHGELAVVFAQLHPSAGAESQGVHAFLVPLRDGSGHALPGVDLTDNGRKIGLNGVDNGQIGFDHVRVPRGALLNRYATVDESGTYSSPIENPNRRFFTMLGTLVQGRVSIAGAGIGAAKLALTVAIKYGARRRQFPGGDADLPLLDHRLHRRRLFPLLAETFAVHFAQQTLVAELDEMLSGPVRRAGQAPREADSADVAAASTDPQRQRALESRAAGVKALATWHAVHTIAECRQACGGAGYMWENRLGALQADTDVFTTFEGDNHVLLQLVGKGLLTNYSSEFADLDPLGMVRTVAEQALETIIERTAVHQFLERIQDIVTGSDRWDADAAVRDPEYQLAMLRWREEHQLSALVRRMKRLGSQGLSAQEVSSRVQVHLVTCGRSHVQAQILEDFVTATKTFDEGPERDALKLLCDLHALSTIESDRGWWLEHGRLSAERSKEITRTVDALCDQIRPIAEALVDAFGVPQAIWDVPMLDQSE